MAERIRCDELKSLMDCREPFALFDVRERGEYNEGQIYQATSLPRSQIEFRIAELVPRPSISIIVYDDGGERAGLAATTIEELAYDRVSILDGGLPAWVSTGYRTVTGVNVPSKEFGEKVHIEAKVPDILPEELASRLASDENIVLFDVRTLEEHQRFCIPGALSVPGGDLILWAEDLARNSATTYLMHCAGRTRSVIGTQTLRRLGVSNVFALRNGTMGWILAGLEPERNAGRIPPNPSSSSRMAAEKLASRIAKEEGISTISVTELQELHESREGRSVYVVDVRSPAEFLQGHIPGSLSIPGGQAVQRTDDFIAVREAKIVFVSDGQARATMTAYWFKQMGFDNVSVLEGGIERWVKGGNRLSTKVLNPENGIIDEARRTVRTLPPTDLVSFVASTDALVLHVGSSSDFEKGHLPKSLWVSRGWMEIKTNELCPNKSLPIILTCADGRQSVLAARTLQRLGYAAVKVLQGGVDGWNEQGHPIEKGLEGHCVVEPKDSVVPASASGNKEAMVGYLNWELALGEKFKGGADG